jgi:hypothetical protein
MRRAPKDLADARVRDLLRILLDGAEGWDLCEFVRDAEKEEGSPWHLAEGEEPLSYSQIRRYAVKAEKLIAESCRTSRKRLLRKHQAQRRSLYATAVHQGDVRAAAMILKDLADLQGLYPAKGVAVAGKDGGPIVLNIKEEIVSRQGSAALANIVEEVVTDALCDRSNGTLPDRPPPPGAASLPPQ